MLEKNRSQQQSDSENIFYRSGRGTLLEKTPVYSLMIVNKTKVQMDINEEWAFFIKNLYFFCVFFRKN